MHPATKLHHTIDFVAIRSSQRMCCLDVQAMRGASFWMDHCMVRAKLRLLLPESGRVQKRPLPFVVHKFTSKEMCDNYNRCLEQKLVDLSSTNECTAEECWNHLWSGIISSAEEYIGRGYCSNPEWFEDNNKNEALQ